MHPGQVIALGPVLDRQLPVAGDVDVHGALVAAAVERLIEIGEAGDSLGGMVLEGRGLAIDVDEDDAHPDVAAHLKESELLALDIVVAVHPRAADMGGGAQAPVEVVAPGVVGAADRAPDVAGLLHQDHAAVTADVLEHLEFAVLAAHHHQRLAEEAQRLGIPGLGHVRDEAERRPIAEEDRLLLVLEHRRIDIERVRQAAGGADRRQVTAASSAARSLAWTVIRGILCA